MGNFAKAFLFLMGSLLGLSGCHAPSSRWNSSEPFKTKVLVTSTFGTEFQDVTLEGVRDSKTLSGDVAEFFLSPGERVHNGKMVLQGQPAFARFVQDSKGVFVPANNLSLQMVTLYFHLQELKKLELSVRETSVLQWPRKVGLQVQSTHPLFKINNAFYNSELDALFFVPYRKSGTPIALNQGIIAHEHFHSYFAYQVQNPLQQSGALVPFEKIKSQDRETSLEWMKNDLVLKSLNEGLADVWGWIYSQDPDFILLSLPGFEESRSLHSSKMTGTKIESEKSILFLAQKNLLECKSRSDCNSPGNRSLFDAYRLGTAVARTLKNFSAERKIQKGFSDLEVKKEMAQNVLKLLEEVKISVGKKTLSLEHTIVLWARLFEDLSTEECSRLKESLVTEKEIESLCSK